MKFGLSFGPKFFFKQNSFWKNFLDQHFFWTKIFFRTKIFFVDQHFFTPIFFLTKFFGPKFFCWPKFFFGPTFFFGPRSFLDQIFFVGPNFFWSKIFWVRKNLRTGGLKNFEVDSSVWFLTQFHKKIELYGLPVGENRQKSSLTCISFQVFIIERGKVSYQS